MISIAHISDTHFGTEIPEVVAALRAVITENMPDIIVLSGDVTQRARLSQFRAAECFMDSLEAKHKLVVPGNHDIPLENIPMRLLLPYFNYHRVFRKREKTWFQGECVILGYNATSRWRHTRGKLSQRRISKGFKKLPPNTADKITVVVAHQPLAVKWPEDIHNVLIDAPEAAKLLAEKGADIVLSGHVHVPLSATTEAPFPDLPRHFVLAGAGTATSHRTRRNLSNSFYIIECNVQQGHKEIQITQYNYSAKEQRFQAAPPDQFISNAGSWHKVE